MASFIKKGISGYTKLLQTHPYKTKCLTAGFIGNSSDYVC